MTSIVEKGTLSSALAKSARVGSRGELRPAAPREIVWTTMGEGVWVAKRGTDFAGLIEELWGAGFRVTDRHGAIVGEFATLQSARKRIQ